MEALIQDDIGSRDGATTVVQTAAIAPASAPLLKDGWCSVGWTARSVRDGWGAGWWSSGCSLLGVCGDVETVERSRSRPALRGGPAQHKRVDSVEYSVEKGSNSSPASAQKSN
jgi:hypothetical protein